MCGRYRRTTAEEELARRYHIPIPPQRDLPISWNIAPFVFAGLWEGWKDPSTGERLRTCTIITGEPNELVAQIHTRMPVILPEEEHAKWLGEVEDGDLKSLLKPFPADRMRIWAISPRVNSPKNNDPGIIVPIPGDIERLETGRVSKAFPKGRLSIHERRPWPVYRCVAPKKRVAEADRRWSTR